MKKLLVSVITVALLCSCYVGATYSWLIAKSEPITSTFTAGNINISIKEQTSRNQRMLPGAVLKERPEVIVRANSEDCWLFIRIETAHDFDTFLSYVVDEEWTPLDNYDGVYWRKASFSTVDQSFDVLKNNEVFVKNTPTKEDYDKITEVPTLHLTAYAVQQTEFEDARSAWAVAETLGEV